MSTRTPRAQWVPFPWMSAHISAKFIIQLSAAHGHLAKMALLLSCGNISKVHAFPYMKQTSPRQVTELSCVSDAAVRRSQPASNEPKASVGCAKGEAKLAQPHEAACLGGCALEQEPLPAGRSHLYRESHTLCQHLRHGPL